jgi:ectoine hydroxylase-related dioxygenase (phytanoyl-CoA dioxygenase family)
MPTTTTRSTRLDEVHRRQFERDGYLCPLRVLEDHEVKRFITSYMEYTAANKARLDALPPNEKYLVLSETHFVLPWVHEIVTHPRVLDAVESLLGPNLLAWNTNWFSKMPGEKSYVGWHQDGTYWKLHPPTVATAWVALSPSIATNGCMRVIPGTHTQPMMAQRETYIPENALSRGQEIAVEVDEKLAVNLNLQPGEMSLHHIWIVHGSNSNASKDTPRIGLAIRYTKPEVRQESPSKPSAMLVRGRDTFGNFDLQPPPDKCAESQSQERHRQIVDHLRGSLMTDAQRK